MNKYINKIFLTSAFAVVGLLGTTSCTDYLDKSPESDYQANDPYKNFMNFQGFTEELYNCIPVVSNSEYHTCFNYGEDVYWEPQEVRLQTRNVDNGDFGDGLLLIMAILEVEAQPELQIVEIKGIYGLMLGMPFVRLILVLLICKIWLVLPKKSVNLLKDNFISFVLGSTLC